MPRTQCYTATTIDGFIADRHHSLDWLFEVGDERGDDAPFPAFFARVSAFAMGDDLLADPGKWQEYYGDVPAWIFTHRDLPAIPGARPPDPHHNGTTGAVRLPHLRRRAAAAVPASAARIGAAFAAASATSASASLSQVMPPPAQACTREPSTATVRMLSPRSM